MKTTFWIICSIILISTLVSTFKGNRTANKIESEFGYQTNKTVLGSVDCASLEPDNPYSYNTGHYAGYEWYEENGRCTHGNSDSFYDGCLEAQNQDEAYTYCLDNK